MAHRVAHPRRQDEVRERVLSLPERFRATAAKGVAGEWQLEVGGEAFTVSVSRGRCFVRPGPGAAPSTWLTADPRTWLAIDDGSLSGMDAVLAGRVTVRGNLDLGVRLQTLFDRRQTNSTDPGLQQLDVDAGGLRMSTYVAGSGPDVVLLHGLGGSKISLLPLLPYLSPRYRVVIPDLPGHGESDKPRTEYTQRFYARSVRRLMDALGIERAAVLGNSLGGRVALELGVRSPDRVSSLALLAPAVPGFRVRYVLGFTRVIPSELGGVPFPLRERWMRAAIRRLFADPSTLSEEACAAAAGEFIRVYRSAVARMAFFDSLRHILVEEPRPFWARVSHIRVPTLIVWGQQDRLVPVRLAAKLAHALPSSELVVLPGVGHVPQFEAAQETSRALTRFLAAASRAA